MIAILLFAAAATAQTDARRADLGAIDAAVRGVYDVISGPPGQKRDFDRMRAMFSPGATMRAIGPKGVRGGTVEEYIARNSAILEKEGFTERELGRRVELWGSLATVWSAYDGRTADGSFHERGIRADLSLIKGWKADESGNLLFHKTARNFNQPAATCGKVCVAEVEEIVPVGSLDPDCIHLPSIYVNRLILGAPYDKKIEFRTVRERVAA